MSSKKKKAICGQYHKINLSLKLIRYQLFLSQSDTYIILGAIQIMRDTLLALFRHPPPLSPHVTIGDIFLDTPPIDADRGGGGAPHVPPIKIF